MHDCTSAPILLKCASKCYCVCICLTCMIWTVSILLNKIREMSLFRLTPVPSQEGHRTVKYKESSNDSGCGRAGQNIKT